MLLLISLFIFCCLYHLHWSLVFVLSFARPIRFNLKKKKAGKKETHLLILQMVPLFLHFHFGHVKRYTNSAPHFLLVRSPEEIVL